MKSTAAGKGPGGGEVELQVGDWEVWKRRSCRRFGYFLESGRGGRELIAGGSREEVRNY